jgi:iron complex transport system substrate-binding protein
MIVHAAFLFDEADARVVAVEQRTQRGASMLPLVDSAFERTIQLERDAAAEAIAAARPDVVLLKSYLAGSLGAPLEALGLATLYLDLETPEQFFRDVRVLGDLFGNPQRAEAVLGYYQARLDRVAAACAGVPQDERPTVLVLQHSARGGETALTVPPDAWLQTIMVDRACGLPVWRGAAGDGWTVVGLEQIAAWDPDKIFVIDYSGDPSPAVASLRVNPAWAALRAVRDGELHAFPGDFLSWDQPDPRWILGLEWLASRILPAGAYPFDTRAALQTFYQDLYGLGPETFAAEVLPLLNGDVGP